MIRVTSHFLERYAERVCKKTKRGQLFANRAYHFGQQLSEISDSRLRDALFVRANRSDCDCRIYQGYVYWFSGNTAITVYSARWLTQR